VNLATTPATPQTVQPFNIRSILAPLAAIILGTFMAVLDTTVVNNAIPTLEHAFNTDLHTIEWVVTGYLLAQAAVIPLAGWLSDRFGAKPLYLIALTIFTLGSTLCATASEADILIAYRVLQGLGGGMLIPLGMSFIYRLAPPEKRGTVMGAFGIPVLLGPALGPILAGWFIQYADWRYIFLINVPVGVAAIALGLRALPAMPPQRVPGRLDIVGAALAPLGFAALVYGITESSTSGWTGRDTVAGLAVGAAALLAFAVRELTTEEPLLELRAFRSLQFTLAVGSQWIVQFSLMAGLFLIPLFLQQSHGYSALDTGIYLLPQAIAAALFMSVGGRLFDRLGARPLVFVGMILVTLSSWLLAHVSASTTGLDLFWPLVTRGAGVGVMMMGLNTHVINVAPRAMVSRVTALAQALNNVIGSLTVAGLATILQNRFTYHAHAARQAIGTFQHAAVARAATSAQATPHPGSVPNHVVIAVQHYAAEVMHQAAALAFDDTFLITAWIAGAGILLSVTLRRPAQVEDADELDSIHAIAV
jgi:EmrB/QacA subfamily drug resistance transporter